MVARLCNRQRPASEDDAPETELVQRHAAARQAAAAEDERPWESGPASDVDRPNQVVPVDDLGDAAERL